MGVFRVLMIEDDDAEAAELETAVRRYASERSIALSVTREASAFDLFEQALSCDLVLLDIDLPGINGMEAAEALRDRGVRTPIIFVTNLAQYAVHGYAVDALDFIVKPVTWGSVSMALDRALRAARHKRDQSVVIRTRDGAAIISRRDLLYVEVRSHDLLFHEAGKGEPVLGHGSLSAVEQDLADGTFVRVNASCLVNMGHISRVRKDSLLMDDGSEQWFSRRKKKEALEKIAEYLGGSL